MARSYIEDENSAGIVATPATPGAFHPGNRRVRLGWSAARREQSSTFQDGGGGDRSPNFDVTHTLHRFSVSPPPGSATDISVSLYLSLTLSFSESLYLVV